MKIPADEKEYRKKFKTFGSIQWAIDGYNDNHLFNRRSKSKMNEINEADDLFDDPVSDNIPKIMNGQKNGFLKANRLFAYYLKIFSVNDEKI